MQMNVDMYGHATQRDMGSIKNHRSSTSVVYAATRGNYKINNERRFMFKSYKIFMYAIMLSITSSYQLARFVARVREYQGVAFFIPFTFVYVCLGMPVLMSQVFIGHYARVGIINAWRLSPLGTGIGYTMLVLSLIKAIAFARIATKYVIHIPLAMMSPIPWLDCNLYPDKMCVNEPNSNLTEQLNENNCCEVELNMFGNCDKEIEEAVPFPSLLWHKEQYDFGSSYNMGDPITMEYELAACLILVWFIIFVILQKELRFFSKLLIPIANTIMIMMTVFLLIVVCEGGETTVEGVKYFFNLKISALKTESLWWYCFMQGFDSLHVAYGTHILYSSYAPRRTNAVTTAVAIGFLQYFFMLLVTFFYAALGSVLAFKLGAPSPRCVRTEDWAVFHVAPGQYFGKMAHGALWSVLYYLTFTVLDLVYLVLLMFSLLLSVWDAWPQLRRYRMHITLGLCIFCFLCGLPLMTNAGHRLNVILNALIIPYLSIMTTTLYTVMVMWVYGVIRLSDDIQFMTGSPPSEFWTLMWYLLPLPLIGYEVPTIIAKLCTAENESRYYIVFCIALVLLLPIPVLACYQGMVYFRAKNFYRVLFPAPDWGPVGPEERHRRLHFNPRKAVRYSVVAPLKWRPPGLISKRQLKMESDRLESHRKIFLEYIKIKREEAAAKAAAAAAAAAGAEVTAAEVAAAVEAEAALEAAAAEAAAEEAEAEAEAEAALSAEQSGDEAGEADKKNL